MDGRRRLAAPLLAFLLLPLGFAFPARADDPPKPEEPKPEEPKPDAPKPDEPKKPERKKFDDTNIFADWKLVKLGGIQNAKNRGKYWEEKGGVLGKSLCWLGAMWNRGEVYDKSVAVWEQFLEWKPPTGDSKDDVKERDNNAKNREFVRMEVIGAYLWKGDYPGAAKAAGAFREEFPNSQGVPEAWDLEGQAYRLSNDLDKALAAFGKAADMKLVRGLLNVVDIHLAEGRFDDAKAAFTKYPMDEGKAPVTNIVKAWLEKIGTDAPPIDKAVNVGTGTPPTDWKGKVTVTYLWHVQLSNGIRRMQLFDHMVTEVGDKVQSLGITTYHKVNTATDKIEADLTEEKEAEGVRNLIAKEFPRDIPAPVLLPKDVLDVLGLKQEGQMVIVDAEGKIRYMRLNDMTKYDLKAVQYALKKFTAPTTPSGG